MEVDFDKEIDALLRKARRDGPVLVGDVAAPHLEADEIAAFAENALPGKTRALYMKHLADCDRCRGVLSNVLVMSTDEAPALAGAAAAPGVITIAERDLPWYRKLFLFPNLAYVMGSLVLVFGGFLAFTLVQRTALNDSAMVSQAPEAQSEESGPSFQFEPPYDSANSAANAAANMSNSMSAANSNAAPAVMATPALGDSAPVSRDNNFVLDGTSTGAAAATAPPPPPVAAAAAQPTRKDAETDDMKAEEKQETNLAKEMPKNDAALKQQYSVPSQSGPMRNNESQYNRQLENLDRRRAAAVKAKDRDEEGSRRSVGGRTFERKQSVWYDVSYQGRPTINVRRGTDEFNRLDGGLRSIANQLSGTIVVVWGAKAYRIQ